MKAYANFYDGCKVGTKLFFCNMNFNAFFYLDLTDLSTHFICSLPSAKIDKLVLSAGQSFVDSNAVYFLPQSVKDIMRYNFVEKKEQVIPISDYVGTEFLAAGFVRCFNQIIIFPYEVQKGVYILDLHTLKVKKDKELSALMSGISYVNAILVCGSRVLINENGDDKIIELDVVDKKIIRTISLLNDIQIYQMLFDGNHYWILQSKSTDIYEWDKENNSLQKYINRNAVWESRKCKVSPPYSNLIFLEDEILVLNGCLKNIMRINKKARTIESPILFPEGFQLVNHFFRGWHICNGYCVLGDKVLIYPCRGNMLLIYDRKNKKLSGKEMTVSETDVPCLRDMVLGAFEDDILHFERYNQRKQLNEFIYYILEKSGNSSTKHDRFGNMGSSIYRMVREIKI